MYVAKRTSTMPHFSSDLFVCSEIQSDRVYDSGHQLSCRKLVIFTWVKLAKKIHIFLVCCADQA